MRRHLAAAFLIGVFVGHYVPHYKLHGDWRLLSLLPLALLIVFWAFLYVRMKAK